MIRCNAETNLEIAGFLVVLDEVRLVEYIGSGVYKIRTAFFEEL